MTNTWVDPRTGMEAIVEVAGIGGYNFRRMTNPEALKTTIAYLKGAWSALGPLAGVLIGAWLARSWDKRKWIDDNRKEECRELLTSVSNAAFLILRKQAAGGVSEFQVDEAFMAASKTFEDRIFIAGDIHRKALGAFWSEAASEFRRTGDAVKFDDAFTTIKKAIVAMALRA